MKKYLFLGVVLALTAGGTLTSAVREPAVPAPVTVQDDDAVEDEAPADDPAGEAADTLFAASYVGEVAFPHRYHIDDEELACDECHHETNAATLHLPRDHDAYFEDFWLDCTVCHRENGEHVNEPRACSECHPDQPRDVADEAISAKVAIHRNCEECHDFGTGAEASENCEYCHSGPKKSFDVGQ